MAAALNVELFIERSEVVTHCGLTFAPLMRSFVYMSEGSSQTVPCRSLAYAHTHCYVCKHFHMYVHTGKWFPCKRAGHTLVCLFTESLSPGFTHPNWIFLAQSQHFGPFRGELYPLLLRKQQSGGSGSLAGSCWQSHSQVTL